MHIVNGDWQKQGLRYNPFHTIVSPRPIGWTSTVNTSGKPNLAPFAYFNAVNTEPEQVMLGISNRGHAHKNDYGFELNSPKDTLQNIIDTREFVINIVTDDLAEAMNKTSHNFTPGVDEFEQAGITPEKSHLVSPPRVKETPIALECRLWRSIELPKSKDVTTTMIIGTVVSTYINDDLIAEGALDVTKITTIGRLGSRYYCRVNKESIFQMTRPDNYTKGSW